MVLGYGEVVRAIADRHDAIFVDTPPPGT